MQRAFEALPAAGRLVRKNIDGGAAEVAAAKRLGQGVDVDDLAPGGVDEHAPGLICASSAPPIIPRVSAVAGTCRLTTSATPSSSARRRGRPGVAERQLVDDVVVEHPHADRLGQHRELRADVAVADDAERLAAHLVGAGFALRHSPRCARADFSGIRRISMMISPNASSATERVFE